MDIGDFMRVILEMVKVKLFLFVLREDDFG